MPNLDEIREIGSLTVSVEREEQLEACLKVKNIQRIYLDEASFSEEEIRIFAKKIKERGIEAALRFRRIEKREDPGKTCLSWLTENEKTSLFSAAWIRFRSYREWKKETFTPFLIIRFTATMSQL